MKAPFTLLLLAAIRALAQDYYSGAATFTISGTAVTFGGTDSAAFAAATATAEDISESSSSSYKGNLDSTQFLVLRFFPILAMILLPERSRTESNPALISN